MNGIVVLGCGMVLWGLWRGHCAARPLEYLAPIVAGILPPFLLGMVMGGRLRRIAGTTFPAGAEADAPRKNF